MAKTNGKGASSGKSSASDTVTSDPRFSRLHTDPRFLKPRRDDTKVVVDERFKDIFTDAKGKKKTDKYGRRVGKGQSDVDQMKRFYRLDDTESAPKKVESDDSEIDEDVDSDPEQVIDYARGEGRLESSSEEESSEEDIDDTTSESSDGDEDDDEDEDVMVGPSSVVDKERKRRQHASNSRAFGDEDDDEDDGLGSDLGEIDLDEDVDEEIYAQLDEQARRAIADGGIEGEFDDENEGASASKKQLLKGKRKDGASRNSRQSANKIPRGDDSSRLAVVNLDWDYVRAKDVFKIFSSVVSPLASVSAADALRMKRTTTGKNASAISQVRGRLLNVRVYPSEFGKERMAREDIEGPPPEIFKGRKDDDSEEEVTAKSIIQVDEGGEFDEEALRKYQLDRLRYYYAVATFDSKETARHVYNEIDGTEMERTANMFDLRFVPDDMELPDGEEGRDAEYRDQATEEVTNYKGLDFKTDALRHSRVKLTWDQDDPERSKLTKLVSKGGLSKDQLRDDDFKAYLASDTESEAEDEATEGKVANAGRDRLRALLDLSGPDGFGGKRGKKNGGVFDDPAHDNDEQGDMQITFTPGLSESAAKKAGNKKGSQDETTLDKYLRKQKEKKEKRRAQRTEDAGEDAEDAATSIPAEGAIDSTEAGFDDPFFNSDNDIDMDDALAGDFDAAPSSKSKDKKMLKAKLKAKSLAAPKISDEDEKRERAQLSSLIGDTNDEVTQEGRQHFDMKDIVRVESGKDAKRAKMLKKLSKKKQKAEQDFQERKGNPLVQDTFEVNARDERFGALMDDHRFAIDPSHPGFAKTKAMQKIMDERRKQLDSQNGEEPLRKSDGNRSKDNADTADLTSLIEKLKRQNANDASGELPKKKRQRKSKMASVGRQD